VVKAAKVGAQGVKDVATDALGAAASAAVGVVLGRVSEALGGDRKKAGKAAPEAPPDKQGRAKSRAAKKRSTGKKKGARQASRNKASARTKGTARKGSARKKTAGRRAGR